MSVGDCGMMHAERVQEGKPQRSFRCFPSICRGLKQEIVIDPKPPVQSRRRWRGKQGDMTMKDFKLQVEYLSPSELKKYKNNARKHDVEDLEAIMQSIRDFGFNDPIGIWGKAKTIVEGHGRLLAALELGLDKVPVIRLDHLNSEQRKAYALAHNRTAELSEWDEAIKKSELKAIKSYDMRDYGFGASDLLEFYSDAEEAEEDDDPADDDDSGYYGDERERNFNATNFDEYDATRTEGRYDMPILEPVDYVPDHLIGFNYVKTSDDFAATVHFYIDDYQFERIWNRPEDYMGVLHQFAAVMTPNFSVYLDMPEAAKIWNTFRARLLGQMMQDYGMTVIPIVYWSDERSFEYCFDGLPVGGTLSVNNIINSGDEGIELWKAGMDELIRRKKPKRIILYGTGRTVDYDFGDIEVITYQNSVTDRMRA